MPEAGPTPIQIMPFSMIVGQDQIKRALELAFIAPRIGGVLLSGRRGTGKSTAVRAFARMVSDRLPVTLPINATEDRVVGGWEVEALLSKGEGKRQPGLLDKANGGILYVDEVNLLDDHIVNIILDVTSTGLLTVQREAIDEPEKELRFTLVGTMNPAEGGLRPQLLDRFGLMVNVVDEANEAVRVQILGAVLAYETARALEKAGQTLPELDTLKAKRAKDQKRKQELIEARDLFPRVVLSSEMAVACVRVGKRIQVEGHRGDYIMALASRATRPCIGGRRFWRTT